MITSLWTAYNKTPIGGEQAIKSSEYKQSYERKDAGQIAGSINRLFTSVEGRPKKWKKLDLPTEKQSHFRANFNAYPHRSELQEQLREAVKSFKDRNGDILGNHFSKLPGASVYKHDYVRASASELAQNTFDPTLFVGVETFKTAGQPRLVAGYRSPQQAETTYKAHHVDFHVRLCDCDPQQRPQRSAQSVASARRSATVSSHRGK